MVSMLNYATKALKNFNITPQVWTNLHPINGRAQIMMLKKQLSTPLDTSLPIPGECKRRIQQIVGTFLYYAHAVEYTIPPALNTISKQQAKPTQNDEPTITHFLDYADTSTSAIVQYKAINMILHIDSDASYLSEQRAHSQTVGQYYLRFLTDYPTKFSN